MTMRSPALPGGLAARVSTRVAFFVAGFGMSAWAPLVPYAKQRAGLDDAALGLLLLCLGAGSLITMPLTGALAPRLGCRALIVAAAALVCLTLPLLGFLQAPFALGLALFLFGAGVGTVDVAVNIQAVQVEKANGRALMSGFHGLFSVGGIAGAGGVSLLLWLGAAPLEAALAVSALIVVAILACARHLLPDAGPASASGAAKGFAIPHGIVLFIGLLTFIAFLAEGAILDWSAVLLTAHKHLDAARAGLGYASFAIAMTFGRLYGDRIVQTLGGKRVLVVGGLLSAAGLALAVFAPYWPLALAGFALVGLGASNIVPVLYSAIGRQQAMPDHQAVAAVTTLGYAGILAGPALIGLVAHLIGLPFALLGVAALLTLVAASARIGA
ncbi:MFS transporter [Pseudomonas sp. RIT-PI-AD]|uniref:MFS transporter n=1 Tax=Pseudomonas sp. RIT-PI-AD TaxID=3035294 RepID=UPI0021D9BB06|nr:MFS transporter [Pseudomonas sp. RIT-PI-AD]